ncbi:MAG: alpha/beta hydrolase [Clostridiales bacterium]|nr:alpha/beta hydrolase [Clostridiales bacterium]
MRDELTLDTGKYRVCKSKWKDETVIYRAYEEVCYVGNPVLVKNQSMNIYVPEAYFHEEQSDGWTAETAPVYFPNGVGGYMPAEPLRAGKKGMGGAENGILEALSRGFVVASPGARGHSCRQGGLFAGKAPACIADLKAAVRYLRHNRERIPGDTEKIISNGTSAGGALSALLGATGNCPDYEEYLDAAGAARERDDIFAASCYCPITNLEHADMAYEWQYGFLLGEPPREKTRKPGMSDRTHSGMNRKGLKEIPLADQKAMSEELGAAFPRYVNALSLRWRDGLPVMLSNLGEGALLDLIRNLLLHSAQQALDQGREIPFDTGVRIQGREAADLDYKRYLAYLTRKKAAPAFDSVLNHTFENRLFGSAQTDCRHFTDFSFVRSRAGGERAEDIQIRLMNPMNYIGAQNCRCANYYRIRHGAADRDTSFAIPVLLAAALTGAGVDTDISFPWDIPHAGNYDPDELFAWMEHISRQ